MKAGRFVLLRQDPKDKEGGWYCTSWDTWEEAEVAFESRPPLPGGPCESVGCGGDPTRRIPHGYKLIDEETGRIWLPGARYEWEDAST